MRVIEEYKSSSNILTEVSFNGEVIYGRGNLNKKTCWVRDGNHCKNASYQSSSYYGNRYIFLKLENKYHGGDNAPVHETKRRTVHNLTLNLYFEDVVNWEDISDCLGIATLSQSISTTPTSL